MEAENGLGSLDPEAQEFRPAHPPPPLRLPGPNQNSFIPLLLSPCYPYNLQQHQNQQFQGPPFPPPPPPPPPPQPTGPLPPYPLAARLGGPPPPPRLPHLHEILCPNAPPTAPAYVSPSTTISYFMTNTMSTHHQTSSVHSPPPVPALTLAAIAPIPAQLPPPPSSTPTRALLLSAVPTDVSETIVRRELEVFGDVRAVEMERARREGIVTVHFYDLRAAHAAMEEIHEQHMQQQNRLRIHYTCIMMSPPGVGGIVDGTHIPPVPCPQPAKGLIAGRAVWAQFTFPATDAYPDGLNQGTLVVFNLDSQITTSRLGDIFEPFGAVRELRETPMKKHQRFVEFYDVRDAAKALSAMNGKEINGKQLVIEFSRPGGHNSKKLFFCNNNNNNNNTGGGSSSNYPHHHKTNYQNYHHYGNRAAFNRNNIKFPSHHPPPYHHQAAAATVMLVSPVHPRRMARRSRRGVMTTSSNLLPRALYDNTLLEDGQGLDMVSCGGRGHNRVKSSSSDDHTKASESTSSVEAAMGTLTLGYMDHESPEIQGSCGINVGQCSKMVYKKRSSGSIGSTSNGGSSSSSSGGGADCSKQCPQRQQGKGRIGGKGSWKGGKQKKSFDPRFLIKEETILVSDFATGSSSSSRDTRTTVMIKNIPNKYSQKLLLNMLDNHCIHCNEQITVTAGAAADSGVPLSSYDFVYLPIDFNNKCNVGYGFVNMTSPEATLRLYKAFHQQHWEVFNSRKICEVTYARVQGLEALKEHFKNSKFACETDEYLPVIFYPPRDGRSLTDPLPIVAHHQQHRSPKSISMDGADDASSASIFIVPSDDIIINGEDDSHHQHDDGINGDDGVDGGCGAAAVTAHEQHHHEYHGGDNECVERQQDDVAVTDVGLGSGLCPPSNGGDITHDSDIPAAATGLAS